MQLTVVDALKRLQDEGLPFTTLFKHGTLEVELYKPELVDLQKPHTRDEIYVVATGKSQFTAGEVEYSVKSGDVLFVPAGMEHRFTMFAEDFSTWVLFYGPEGGECPK